MSKKLWGNKMSFIQAKTTFENITNQVWTNLEAAYDNELTFRETTISDLIFLYLKQQNLSYVILEPTKHSDEKHQGTDWEWWIGSPKLGWLRYSVQAKIYSSKSRSSGQSHYKDLPNNNCSRKDLFCEARILQRLTESFSSPLARIKFNAVLVSNALFAFSLRSRLF